MDLHRFWDRLLTTSSNTNRLRNRATTLRNRPEYAKSQLTELSATDFESWAKESFQIAKQITYQNGAIPGTSKGSAKECATVSDVGILPAEYTGTAGHIADRRIMLAGYRLADFLQGVTFNYRRGLRGELVTVRRRAVNRYDEAKFYRSDVFNRVLLLLNYGSGSVVKNETIRWSFSI